MASNPFDQFDEHPSPPAASVFPRRAVAPRSMPVQNPFDAFDAMTPIEKGVAKQDANTAGFQADAQRQYEARQAALAQQDKEHPELAPNPMVVDPAPAVDPNLEYRKLPLPPSPVQKFGTQAKMDLIEDENRQRQIMARALFPDRPVSQSMQRVGFYEGNPVYIDDNGEMQQLSSGMTRFLANMTANSPEMVGSLIGAPAGIGGSAMGAAGAHGIKRGVASMIFNEPTTIGQNLTGMAIEGGLGAAGELPGRAIGLVGNRRAMFNMTPKELKAAQEIQRRIKADADIDVDIAQASGDRRFISARKFLARRSGESGEIFQAQDERALGQLHVFQDKVLDGIATAKPAEIAEAGGVNAAEAALRSVRKEVSNKVRPLYTAAYAKNSAITDPAVTKFLQLPYFEEAYARGQKIAELEGYPAPPAQSTTTTSLHPLTGAPQSATTKQPVYDLRGLDYLKQGLDDVINDLESNTGKPTKLTGALRQQRNDFIAALDALPSPEYKAARQLYGQLKASTIDPLANGPVGVLAKLKNRDAVGAAAKIFGDADVTPTQIALAKQAIDKEKAYPDAWNDLTRTWLSNVFNKARTESQTGVELNPAGKSRQVLYGNPKLRAKMDAILPAGSTDIFDKLMEASQVLSRTPLAGSNTAVDTEFKEALKGRALPVFKWFTSFRKKIVDAAEESMIEKGSKEIAIAMTDPTKAKHLRRVLRMRPSVQQGILLSTVVGARTGAEALRDQVKMAPADSDIFAKEE